MPRHYVDIDISPDSWRKSSFSMCDGDCVEVASLSCGCVAVRDSKNTPGPILSFAAHFWCDFVASVRRGEFDQL